MPDSRIGELELSNFTNKSDSPVYTQVDLDQEAEKSPTSSSSSSFSLGNNTVITNLISSNSSIKNSRKLKTEKLHLILKKFKSPILLLLGILIGFLLYDQIIADENTDRFNYHTNPKKIHADDVRKDSIDLYFNLFKQTERYKENQAFKDSNPFDHMVTYNRLINAFTYLDKDEEYDGIIEKNIIQMWLNEKEDRKNFVPIESLDLEDDDQEYNDGDYYYPKVSKKSKILTDDYPYRSDRQTWIDENPGYTYLMFSYLQVYDVVKKNFANTVPEVYDAFDMLPHVILKSDFGRYLLVYLFGGLYADIDTKCQKPIDEWFDNYNKFKYKIGFVASLEADINLVEWNRYMPRRVELLQWAFKSKKRHHFMAYLISKIVATTYRAKYDNKLVAWSDQYVDIDKCSGVNIVDWTGPGEFTDSFIEYVNLIGDIDITDVDSDKSYAVHPRDEVVGPKIPVKNVKDYNKNKGWLYTWYGLIRLQTPRIINDLLVLPYSFKGDDPCDEGDPYCYLSHAFSGGWKDKDAS
ncbi:hypothetical protein BVG19_g1930 [[Candida] boidinii]|nr:hypothetical protein BVG19_g1930 [[Candida] boidinii]OWB51599.1 hypothetical protein B5S27_g3164 [[Candida] boidinii]